MSKWSEFHARHNERNFTPVFNAQLEALIDDEEATAPERAWAWVMRTSWGNHSDHCVGTKGETLTQADYARKIGVHRREVNPTFQEFGRRNYVQFKGREIHPVDDPTFADSSLIVGNGGDKHAQGKGSFSNFFSEVWATQHPTEFAEYQEHDRRRKEISLAALTEWKKRKKELSETGETNQAQSPKREGQPVRNGSDSSAKTGTTSERRIYRSKQENVKEGPPSSSFSKQVREALEHHGTTDDDVIQQLIKACRMNAPDCTADEICHFIAEKAKLINRRTSNPAGFLLTIVPKCFAGESFRTFRAKAARKPQAQTVQPISDEEYTETLEGLLARQPQHIQASEWRETLRKLKEKTPAAKTATAGGTT